ncbi:MAG TPA: YetF domain-containing protein [Blastocatellia bacterium]|nr:YetF domain-containing protein [Blastocatellia bacterium]
MFFQGWAAIGRVFVLGVLAYLAVVLFLRLSGKRTLSLMDPFDFVITTALGSVLAQTILTKEVTLLDGLAAFAVLIGLQFIVTWCAVHNHTVRRLIKPQPKLLFYRGEFLKEVMNHEHVHEVEILAAARGYGLSSLDEVEAVVLEANSHFSVISRADSAQLSTLANVSRSTSMEV